MARKSMKTPKIKQPYIKGGPIDALELGVDYGNKVDLTDGSKEGARKWTCPRKLSKMMLEIPIGATLAAERSFGSADLVDFNKALDIAKERNITLKSINQNATKNFRLDTGTPKPEDGDESCTIFHIAFETDYHCGTFKKRALPAADDLEGQLVLARQRGYKAEKTWLKQHKFPVNAIFCQYVIVARVVNERKGNLRMFDSEIGLFGLGKRSIPRSETNRRYLRDTIKVNVKASMPDLNGLKPKQMSVAQKEALKLAAVEARKDKSERKKVLKNARAVSRRIFLTLQNEANV